MNIVISLGGSVLSVKKENLNYLKKFIELVKKYSNKDYKFVIYCGGGETARKYIETGKKLGLKDYSLDLIGIYATRLNAIMLKNLFGNYADNNLITDPTKKIRFKKNIIIAAGWKPGWSTDYDAVLVAKQIHADKIINITNISHVFDKDPRKFKDAKKLNNISWNDFRKLVGSTWIPGLSMPFDPIASKEAARSRLKVFIINNGINKLRDVLDDKKVDGTAIQ